MGKRSGRAAAASHDPMSLQADRQHECEEPCLPNCKLHETQKTCCDDGPEPGRMLQVWAAPAEGGRRGIPEAVLYCVPGGFSAAPGAATHGASLLDSGVPA